MSSDAKNYKFLDASQRDTSEQWWADKEQWLLKKGYQLRDRFRRDWKPSWEKDRKLRWGDQEDSVLLPVHSYLFSHILVHLAV